MYKNLNILTDSPSHALRQGCQKLSLETFSSLRIQTLGSSKLQKSPQLIENILQ